MNAESPRPTSGGNPPPAALHPVDWTVESGAVDDVLRAMNRGLARRQRRRRAVAAAGAMAAVLVAGFAWLRVEGTRAEKSPPSVVVTQPAREVLPDGTIVELRRGARIVPEFSTGVRRVVLAQGQAHFAVTKDPARPFVVVAGGVEVRAVGTAFAVDLDAKTVEVLVTEGRVALDRSHVAATDVVDPNSAPLAYLDAGHNAVVALPPSPAAPPAAPQVTPVAAAEIAARLAWRVPRLEFSGTPLSEALALINRYHPVRFSFADPALGQVRVSGILRADNTENLWRLLEEQHGLHVERGADGAVVLSRGR